MDQDQGAAARRLPDGATVDTRSIEADEWGLRSNAWEYSANSNDGHPAQMPYDLARDHVATWSNPGDLVLDPFSGSGTTAKAAKTLGRQFIGLEVNPEYCAIAEQRIAQGVLELA